MSSHHISVADFEMMLRDNGFEVLNIQVREHGSMTAIIRWRSGRLSRYEYRP